MCLGKLSQEILKPTTHPQSPKPEILKSASDAILSEVAGSVLKDDDLLRKGLPWQLYPEKFIKI